MMDARWTQLRQILVESGWVWRDDALYAPHETMWFTTSTEHPNFAQFRDRMTEAATATADTAEAEAEIEIDQTALHEDLVSLVAALDVILDGN